MGYKKPAKIVLALIIGAAVVYYVVRTLHDNAAQLKEHNFVFRYDYLAISYLLLIANQAIVPVMWKRICNCFGVKISYRDSLEVLFLSYLTRYVPGKVLTVVSQVGLAREKKVPVEFSFPTAILLQIFNIIVGLQVFVLTFLLWPETNLAAKSAVLLAGVVVLLASLQTRFLRKAVRFALNKLKRSEVSFDMPWTESLALQGLLLASWGLYCPAVYFFMRSFWDISPVQCLIVTGIQAISWLIGYYTLISPGGIGVREGVQIVLLGRAFSPPFTVLIPIALRLWMTVGDILVFSVGLAVRLLGSRKGATARTGP
jgi:uncharacterized membrane protein YbhN (UPF0104 family)